MIEQPKFRWCGGNFGPDGTSVALLLESFDYRGEYVDGQVSGQLLALGSDSSLVVDTHQIVRLENPLRMITLGEAMQIDPEEWNRDLLDRVYVEIDPPDYDKLPTQSNVLYLNNARTVRAVFEPKPLRWLKFVFSSSSDWTGREIFGSVGDTERYYAAVIWPDEPTKSVRFWQWKTSNGGSGVVGGSASLTWGTDPGRKQAKTAALESLGKFSSVTPLSDPDDAEVDLELLRRAGEALGRLL